MRSDVEALAEKVAARISEEDLLLPQRFSSELKAALALSDQFQDILPEEYVLPLDALAGFWVVQKIKVRK